MTDLVDNFIKVMAGQPLSLALCAMNLILLWIMNKQFNTFSKARSEAAAQIVQTQEKAQVMLADCVSKEIMAMILASLERDRETYRAMLPTYQSIPDSMQKITKTMLDDRDKETARMQSVITKLEKKIMPDMPDMPDMPPPSVTEQLPPSQP